MKAVNQQSGKPRWRRGRRGASAVLCGLALGTIACDPPNPPTAAPPATQQVPPSGGQAPPKWHAGTERPALRPVRLEVTAARLGHDELHLDLLFVNTSDRSFAVAGELGAEAFRLVEPEGRILTPQGWSPELERLDDGGGLAPGTERGGWVSFPRPVGERLELRLDAFEPIILERRHLQKGPVEGRPANAPSASPSPPATPRVETNDLQAANGGEGRRVQALLQTQAQALTSYDLNAYLSTFLPAAHEVERRAFLHLRPLPVEAVQLELTKNTTLRRADGGRLQATVDLVLRLEGIPPDNPFVYSLRYVFAPTVDGLLVEAIQAGEGESPMWRRGELVLHRTNHFLILTEPVLRGDLVDLAADAEAAWARLQQKGLPLESGYVLHFVARADEFRRLAGHPAALGVAVGRYTLTAEGYEVDSRAIYVNGPVFTQRRGVAAEIRRTTVTHELVHLALAEDSRPFTPAWLKEGVAVYFSEDVSFDANRRMVQGGLERFRLPEMTRAAALGQHDAGGSVAAAEYLFSGNVVAWLAQKHGLETLLEFYGTYAEVPPSVVLGLPTVQPRSWWRVFDTDPVGTLTTELTENALGQHFGLDLESLETQVKDWLGLRHR